MPPSFITVRGKVQELQIYRAQGLFLALQISRQIRKDGTKSDLCTFKTISKAPWPQVTSGLPSESFLRAAELATRLKTTELNTDEVDYFSTSEEIDRKLSVKIKIWTTAYSRNRRAWSQHGFIPKNGLLIKLCQWKTPENRLRGSESNLRELSMKTQKVL